jgi:hypothetical protein
MRNMLVCPPDFGPGGITTQLTINGFPGFTLGILTCSGLEDRRLKHHHDQSEDDVLRHDVFSGSRSQSVSDSAGSFCGPELPKLPISAANLDLGISNRIVQLDLHPSHKGGSSACTKCPKMPRIGSTRLNPLLSSYAAPFPSALTQPSIYPSD